MDRIDRDDPLSGKGGEKSGASSQEEIKVIDFDLARCRRVIADLNYRVSRYANSDRFYEEYEIALCEYFESRGIYCEEEDDVFDYFQSEQDLTKFIAWYSYYFITDEFDKTFPEIYLQRKKSQLSKLEREVLQGYLSHPLSIYEVQSVDLGNGLEIRDIFTGGLYYVWDVEASRNLYKWDLVYAGLVRARDLCFFGGMPLSTIPLKLRHFVENNIRELYMEQREGYDDLEHYLREASAEIYALIENASQHLERLTLPPEEKAGPVFAAAVHFRIKDADAFARALQGSGLFSEEALDRVTAAEGAESRCMRFDERDFRAVPKGSVRRISIHGMEALVAECPSIEDARKTKGILGERLGQALKYRMTVYRRVEPAGVAAAAADAPDRTAEPLAAEDLRRDGTPRKYENWINEKIPDIGNITPREAVKTPEGRRKVLELLKEFENQNERVLRRGLKNADKLVFPLDSIKRDLGL